MTDIVDTELLIVFADFSGYSAQVERQPDLEVARVLDDWYELAGGAIAASGGRVVKFIGDALLAVFPPEHIDRGVAGMLDLKDTADRFMAGHGWQCILVVKMNFGSVAAGHFGIGTDRHYDVLGKAVNAAARLKSKGIIISGEVFKRVAPGVQARFTKEAGSDAYLGAPKAADA
ncbi:MAG TPA: adenylate/guanylate cyclase domain-containing protein [Gemmatimonadales bacterium]|jgi:adenylate cyclase